MRCKKEMLKRLLSKQEIEECVGRLARSIEGDFSGEELIFVCLLKGSFIFTSDLIRSVSNSSKVDFMRVSSYGAGMTSKGQVTVTKDLEENIEGENVIIVEDIVDSGLTLKFVTEMLKQRRPRALKICALLDKRARREEDIHVDYVGFVIPDGFVVGYGIDYAEQYRNLPEIYVVESD
jgi:hypoxanthine phosphoribosyltransferase